jgi:hypothetical protein
MMILMPKVWNDYRNKFDKKSNLPLLADDRIMPPLRGLECFIQNSIIISTL